jgi:hypothetical protein
MKGRSRLRRAFAWARGTFATLVRCTYICACVIGAMALVLVAVDRPSLRLDATLIPGPYLAGAVALVLLACLSRYAVLRTGTSVVIDKERGRLARALARLPVMLRLCVTGVVGAVLLLLALRPSDGNAAYVISDNYTANTPVYATQMLEQFVEVHREVRTFGCDPKYDSPRIEAIVRQAESDGATPALAKTLMTEIQGLPPVNDRLAKVDDELKGRRNDRVYVVSGHRGPDVGVQPWPVGPSRVRSCWKMPPEVMGAAAVTKPRILHYHFTHESAMESVLELDLEVPSPMEFPALTVALVEKGAEKWKAVVNPPGRNSPWQHSVDDGKAFGRYRDRCCYRVQLPRLGDGMVLRLSGPGWDGNEVGVPQFNGETIPLGPRVLVFKPVGADLSALTQLKPFAWDPKAVSPPPVLFDPTTADIPSSAGRPVRLVRAPLAAPPPTDEPTVEVIVTDMPAKNRGPATLYREPAYYGTDLNLVWVDHTWATGMPPLGEGIDLSAHRHKRVHVVSSKEGQTCGPVVFQRDAVNWPNWVSVVVPQLSDWQEWPRQRQQMVAFLLTWAGSLAERNGRSRVAVTGEMLVPADSATMLVTESGPAAELPCLALQVIGALRGDLDGRLVEPSSNGIGGELVLIAGAVIVLLLGPTTVMAWVRTARLRRHGLVK